MILGHGGGAGEVSWYWAWASFVRPRFVGRCWFQRPRSKAGTVLYCCPCLLSACLPPYPTRLLLHRTDHALLRGPMRTRHQGSRRPAQASGRWPPLLSCPARGPRQLFLLWPATHAYTDCRWGFELFLARLPFDSWMRWKALLVSYGRVIDSSWT